MTRSLLDWSLLVRLAPAVLGQPGSLDATFNGGADTTDVRCIVPQNDGKLLIGGGFTCVKGVVRNHIARLNADGSLDDTFDPGLGADELVRTIAVQGDGKILIGGSFTNVSGEPRDGIARLHDNGSLDRGFRPSLWLNNSVFCLAVQADGKVLVGGGFWSVNGDEQLGLARLNRDGTTDKAFSPTLDRESSFYTALDSGCVLCVALQSDDRIVVAGKIFGPNGIHLGGIARLLSSGRLDKSFNVGQGVGDYRASQISTVLVQTDGKLLIAGSFPQFNGAPRSGVARLNSDGAVDRGFEPGLGSSYRDARVCSLAVQRDGKALIGGSFAIGVGSTRERLGKSNGNTTEVISKSSVPERVLCRGLARLKADGSVDGSFDAGAGIAGGSFPCVQSIVLAADGKVLVGGEFSGIAGVSRNALARLNSDGSVDEKFPAATESVTRGASRSGPDGSVHSVVVLPDSGLLISGSFSSIDGVPRRSMARLTADGMLDTNVTFAAIQVVARHGLRALGVQADGRIVVAGSSRIESPTVLARLNPDGSIDPSFSPTFVSGSSFYSAAVQNDGRILVGGELHVSSSPRRRIVRLHSDGSLDRSFDASTAIDGSVGTLLPQTNGMIIVAGSFNITGRIPLGHGIARLFPDGRLDTSFEPDFRGLGDRLSIALAADGGLIVAGERSVIRYRVDGSRDKRFATQVESRRFLRSSIIASVAAQPDSKVLIGGDFGLVNGAPRPNLARLNPDGSLDNSFDPGTGPNEVVLSVAIQSDGKVVIAGQFTSVNNTPCNFVARLLGDRH